MGLLWKLIRVVPFKCLMCSTHSQLLVTGHLFPHHQNAIQSQPIAVRMHSATSHDKLINGCKCCDLLLEEDLRLVFTVTEPSAMSSHSSPQNPGDPSAFAFQLLRFLFKKGLL